MSKKMLIDASHREETRVAVIANGKVEDFDFESQSRKPLRGNIYLARVTRVEPSLQAAFVEYGGNRHGFLAFSEIHSDYYQIPVSDRDVLRKAEELEAELAAQMVAEEQEDLDLDDDDLDSEASDDGNGAQSGRSKKGRAGKDKTDASSDDAGDDDDSEASADADIEEVDTGNEEVDSLGDDDSDEDDESYKERAALLADAENDDSESEAVDTGAAPKEKSLEERYREARRERVKLLRNYRIQEVIKRRQIMLVQVVKEERGNKGAALTTYLSLAGRYCVLMPNTSRGGGISRKITNGADRKRLRRAMSEMEIPPGLGLIIRTAGSKRTKAEIKRDYDYLLRLWENIRDLTLRSIAPCLIYEEASLIKRAIRDLYDKDIGSVQVQGDAGYREAKDFMKMLMPSHAKNVQPYREQVPLFLSTKVEQQLDEMYQPVVKLKSGGYLVIQQTEALISIDVNSGKATKERNIEATALKTNCEAAVEAARQCRLRDLAGLIVIDFIDMEENRNNRTVEKKLKDAMKTDRARIQLGRISTFGLLEMSRQRRRSGIVDGTTRQCPTCHGAGAVRSHEMAALRILRSIEEEALAGRAGVIAASTSSDVALYILNHKRDWLDRIETTYALSIEINADPSKAGDSYEIEKRGPAREMPETARVVTADMADFEEPEEEAESADAENDDNSADDDKEERQPRRRRRRRRGKSNRDESADNSDNDDSSAADSDDDGDGDTAKADESGDNDDDESGGRRRRRRGRRGGRRNRRRNTESDGQSYSANDADETSADSEQSGGKPDDTPAAANDENGDDDTRQSEKPAASAETEKADDAVAPEMSADTAASGSEAAAQTNPEEAETVEPDATGPAAEAVTEKSGSSNDEAQPSDAAETTDRDDAAADDDNEDDDGRPKRTGWWQRALGRS